MTVSKKLVTKKFNVHNAKQFVEANNELFVYVAKHTPYELGDDQLTEPSDSVDQTVLDIYNNMIFAKRVANTDMIHMIPRYNWTANTVYDMYSHLDGELTSKEFYVVTDDTSEYNVFKCLSNAGNTESLIAPSRVGSNADLEPIITGDDYVWKYMYTITQNQFEKFATTAYIPITANTEVIDGAVPGRIDVIQIVDGGQGYDNYIANGVFRTGDIKISGSDVTYGAPETASTVDNFFRGGVLKITSGAGIDQYRRVVNYDGTSSQKKFTLDSPFETLPEVGDTYDIYPYVFVFGDGSESTPAEGMAIVDPDQSNTIIGVEILEPGAGYRSATTYAGVSPAEVPAKASSVLITVPATVENSPDFVAADLQAMIPPPGGHGADPWNELFGNRVCVYTRFANTEGSMIPTENDFRQVGILKNPLFTNLDVFFDTNTAIGTYSVGETVTQFKNIRLAGEVTTLTTANTITKTDAGKISTTIAIANGGINYDSTTNNELVITAPTSGVTATATFANNANGTIITITVTNQGTNYTEAPTATVAAGAGGSNAVLTPALANPMETLFADAFEIGDYVLVQSDTRNWINVVTNVTDTVITASANAPFAGTDSTVSAIGHGPSGVITAVSVGQFTLSNVSGVFEEGAKVIGLSSGATSEIRSSNATFNALELNDKDPNGFNIAVQLTRLVGNYDSGAAFIEDEDVSQPGLISYTEPHGYLHHADISGGANDDILYISNSRGIFAIDPDNERPLIGESSGATLSYLSAKYPGDFVVDSGEVIYYENLDPISRANNTSEIIKIILEF
jgi:hypothetical protein